MKSYKISGKPLYTVKIKTLIFITLYKLICLVSMSWYHIIHINRYTYWNYTLQTAFYMLLSIAYIWKNASYLFHFLSIFIFPIVFGSVLLVFFYIIVILQANYGWLFVDASNLGTGTVSIGTVHTADAIVHYITAIEFFFILVSGYQNDVRISIFYYLNSSEYGSKYIAFRIYYYIAPMVPLLFYTLFFDPFVEYEITSCSPLLLIGIAAFIELLIMIWLFEVMTRNNFTHQYDSTFIYDVNNSDAKQNKDIIGHQCLRKQIICDIDIPNTPFNIIDIKIEN